MDDARVGLDVVRARHDDDVFDGATCERCEDRGEEKALLRRAEPRRLAGREDDRRYDVSTPTFEMTIVCVGCSDASPSLPILSTTSSPSVTFPTIAY